MGTTSHFNSPVTVAKLSGQWETASEEGMNAYKELLNRERFPEGPQLCYSLGFDVRVRASLSDVSPEITVFYMHLTLRDEIRATVQDSPNAYVIFDAGTHIGYIYPPPTSSFYTLDFGVQDQNMDAGFSGRWRLRRE